jgi:hypothetical protein
MGSFKEQVEKPFQNFLSELKLELSMNKKKYLSSCTPPHPKSVKN